MKNRYHILLLLLLTSLLMVSCDGLLNVDSEINTFEEDFQMKSDHDSLYAMVGIFSKLQKLGDRYVLLGELRGDLMETKEDASLYLKQLHDFNVTEDNPYASTKEYYAVINNCNYTIHYVDTSSGTANNKPMYSVMAAAKSIRAWTYMQLVLNYGSAKYIEKPVVGAEDVEKTYEAIDMAQLADLLIKDLLPFKDVRQLNLGYFATFNSRQSLIPIKLLLGDLYLWKEEYEKAAAMYHELMYDDRIIIDEYYTSEWPLVNEKLKDKLVWRNVFMSGSSEILFSLASSLDYGSPFTLDSLSYYYLIAPTDIALRNWASSRYYLSKDELYDGDMRGYDSYFNEFSYSDDDYDLTGITNPIITKYIYMGTLTEKRIVVYRNSLLYLRYAEAINRLGYPLLAFAVMKNGMTPSIIRPVGQDSAIYKQIRSKNGTLPSYMDFSDFRFMENKGIRMRGLGNVNLDKTFYVIKSLPTKQDTIEFVEDKIMEELALETAFEGNRYHDLMRVAIRRNDNHYLADRVAAKYKTNSTAMKNKLMVRRNWYLPK